MKVMSGLDARFFYSETRTAHMHTMKVVVVDITGRDEPLSREVLPLVIEQRLERMPVLRRRIVPTPHGLGNPVLVDDPDFKIANHLRYVLAPAPGGPHDLDTVISQVASNPLRRDRPLWELTVVEGLEHDRVAFVMKIHHALADGVASVSLLENAFVTNDDEAVSEPFNPAPIPTKRELYRAAASSARHAARTLPKVVKRTYSGVRESRAVKKTLSAPLPGPFAGPRTPFNVALTADRTFASVEIPMTDLLDAKRTSGATLNAVFLALCGGAIRQYLERMGELPSGTLIASVPMATRTDKHRLYGNHVDNLFLPIRSDLADPKERVAAIHQTAVAARKVREKFGPDLFEWRSGLVPASMHGVLPQMWGATRLANRLRPPVNLIASCVRGPRERLEVDGGAMTSLISSGPILEGMGLNITAWSYADTMVVSLLGCSASLPDAQLLADDIRHESEIWSSQF